MAEITVLIDLSYCAIQSCFIGGFMTVEGAFWIIGAGGIGSAIAKKCEKEGFSVTQISRPEYDFTDPADVERFFSIVSTLPDVIINTIGVLYDNDRMPEKALSHFDLNWFYESLRINALPVMNIAKALSGKLSRKDRLIFITISARVSSISDNRLGGWYSYRTSKCALNMFIKNISIEWSRLFPGVTICGYHPGTVETPLSEPFKKKVKPEKLFSPALAANYLWGQLQKITPEMTGCLFDWKGERILF